jgi:DNA-binding MarR family transcriptional regulator
MQHHQLDRLAEELFAVVPQLHRLMDMGVRREMGSEASAPQLRLLGELQHGPQSISTLARHLHVSPQAICDLVQDLETRGWLVRSPHPRDRRQHLLTLTPEGETASVQARQQALKHLTPLLKLLSETELSIIAAALPALQRVLNQAE